MLDLEVVFDRRTLISAISCLEVDVSVLLPQPGCRDMVSTGLQTATKNIHLRAIFLHIFADFIAGH